MSTWSDIRDQRYPTELDTGTSDIGLKRAETDIISDIRTNFYLIFDIRHPIVHRSAQLLWGNALANEHKGLGFDSIRYVQIFLLISDVGMNSNVDIGTLAIME